jgi:hypothetical protein
LNGKESLGLIIEHQLAFKSSRLKAKTFVVNNDKTKIALDCTGELWLLNSNSSEIELGPCELFGFNVGTFQENKTSWEEESGLG